MKQYPHLLTLYQIQVIHQTHVRAFSLQNVAQIVYRAHHRLQYVLQTYVALIVTESPPPNQTTIMLAFANAHPQS